MARPRSHDKRSAILLAATQVFANHGLSAATSTISAAAGVAEGTLFLYFKTKDALLNALYREIKLELADAMMSNYPRKKSVQNRLQHLWKNYTAWGVANSVQRKTLTQLKIYDKLAQDVRQAGYAPFLEIETMAQDAIDQHLLREIPLEFISATMEASAQTTMSFMISNPDKAENYQNLGFEIFWKGISRK